MQRLGDHAKAFLPIHRAVCANKTAFAPKVRESAVKFDTEFSYN